MDEKEYYNMLADRFKCKVERSFQSSIAVQIRKVLRDFCQYLPENKNIRILDAGCHIGIGVRFLNKWGYKNAEGVEYLQILVRAAQRKGCMARQGDLHNLIFPDNVFEAIFSRYVLEHCHTPTRAFQEITRVAKPGALIYVVVSTLIGDVLQVPQPGVSIFRTIGEFEKIIPSNLRLKFLRVERCDLGWHEIIYAGRKVA